MPNLILCAPRIQLALTLPTYWLSRNWNRDTFTSAICEYLHINQSTIGTDRTDPCGLSRLVGDIRRLSHRDRSQPETTQLTAAFYAVAHRSVQKILPRRQERRLVRRHEVTRRLRQSGLVYVPIADR